MEMPADHLVSYVKILMSFLFLFLIHSFAPPKAPLTPSEQAEPVMLLALDNSASFMLAADIKRMVRKRLCACKCLNLPRHCRIFYSQKGTCKPIGSWAQKHA